MSRDQPSDPRGWTTEEASPRGSINGGEESHRPGDRVQHVYRGQRDPTAPVGEQVTVTVDGEPLPRRYDLLSASPNGFEYGYGGSGPAQLAIAMLAHACDDDYAVAHYQQFKREVIAELPEGGWTLRTRDLDAWREVVCDA